MLPETVDRVIAARVLHAWDRLCNESSEEADTEMAEAISGLYDALYLDPCSSVVGHALGRIRRRQQMEKAYYERIGKYEEPGPEDFGPLVPENAEYVEPDEPTALDRFRRRQAMERKHFDRRAEPEDFGLRVEKGPEDAEEAMDALLDGFIEAVEEMVEGLDALEPFVPPVPDENCFTLPNGECVGDGPCMHTPGYWKP